MICVLSNISNREIEYLEEDGPLVENQQHLVNSIGSHVDEFPQKSGTLEPEDIWSECISLDDMIEHTGEYAPEFSLAQQPNNIAKDVSVCQKCVQLNFDLQKSQATVSKLQKKCAQK